MSASDVAISPVPIRRFKLEWPRVSGPYVLRPVLEAHLDRVLSTPLTIIVAPAGHGKTRTLVEWLTRRAPDTTWLTLGSHDRDLTQFAAHVAAALDRASPGLAPVLFARLSVPDRLTPGELGEFFGDTLFDLRQDLVLVLDDFHAAETDAIVQFVAGLVLAAPARLHTILNSRRTPSLPLARLRMMGRVNELTAADLRFSEQDTAAMLRISTWRNIDPELAARVHAAVGGWPAAVRLLAIGVGAGGTLRDPSTVPTAHGEQLLLDYLSEEVLDQLTPLQRDLLLRASLPEQFNGSLLESLTTSAAPAHVTLMELETLRGLDLYREIPGLDETWFAYHPLFRDTFQRQLLSELGPSAIADLHREFARWFADEGLTYEAVWHLSRAGDIAAASALIEARIGAAFAHEDWPAIASWLHLIPESAIAQRPGLLLASAWVAYLSGRGGTLASRFGHLRTLRARGALSDAQDAEVDLLTLGATVQSDADRQQAVTVAEEVIRRIPRSHRYQIGLAQLMFGLALGAEGRVQEALDRLAAFTIEESAHIDAASIRGFFGRLLVLWQAGLVSACEQIATDQLQLAHMNGLPVSAGWGQLFLGLVAHERSDLRTATRHFAAVVADAERLHFACVREAFCRQVLIFEGQGKAVEADRALARLREHIIAIEAPEHLAICDSLAARIALFRGDLGAATQWLALARPDPAQVELAHLENPPVTRVMVLIALGTHESLREANTVIEELRRHAEAAHARLPLIDIEALTALLREAEGDRQGATAALRASLAYGAEERITARYAFLPLPLGPILRRLIMQPAPPPHTRAVLTSLETAVGTQRHLDDPTAHASLADTLTSREMDVLRCLARRLTNDEIGDELFISPITVKHHVAHISGKLAVSGRRAAVVRASELGLLA